jgi:hypothetical protein
VDPGAQGALFQSCVDRYAPRWRNGLFVRQFPAQFPFDPAGDHIDTLLEMFFDPCTSASAAPRRCAASPT